MSHIPKILLKVTYIIYKADVIYIIYSMKIKFAPLRKIIKKRANNETSEFAHNQSTHDSGISNDASMLNTEKKGTDRRLQDILSKDHPKRKMNLDRRAPKSERRVNTDPHYNGPVRRYTIDRRRNLKDRRDNN